MIKAEIVGYERDPRDNMIIWVCFSENNIEIPFHQGIEILKYSGHKVWPLVARFQNFIGKTQTQINEWIRINIESQIGNIIQAKNTDKLNKEIEVVFDKLIGTTFQKDTVEIEADFNNDGIFEAVLMLKSDGTYTVK